MCLCHSRTFDAFVMRNGRLFGRDARTGFGPKADRSQTSDLAGVLARNRHLWLRGVLLVVMVVERRHGDNVPKAHMAHVDAHGAFQVRGIGGRKSSHARRRGECAPRHLEPILLGKG